MAGRTVLFAVLIACCWPWSVYTQDAGGVRFSLNGTTYQNNSLVTLEDIDGGYDALLCLTDLTACCRPPYTDSIGVSALGNWFFPNGTRVPSPGVPWDVYRSRGQMMVLLQRRRGGVTGIYSCVVPDAMYVSQTMYIGVYTASTGFPWATYLRYDSQSNTLTCTSTGGPATTVTWRRDGDVITLNATHQQTKRVVDPVMGTYQTVLTIDPSVSQSDTVGTYSCTVENARGESSRIVVISGNGEGVRFLLRGITYQNNSLVTLEDIGEWDDALLCRTDQPVCCRHPYTPTLGNWFFPNGTRLHSSWTQSWTQWDLYRDRGQMLVNMHRRRGGVTGTYHCVIPDVMNVIQTMYIGVYTANTGQVTIPGDIIFQLDTDPATDPPVFTLTCTSTGGPATTVSWRRDGTMLSDDSTYSITSQVLTDTMTATYTHTLTVTGRLVGEYECSVSNIRTPSGSSRTLTVVAAGTPTNLDAHQIGPSSFIIFWTRPATVTGYHVYWSGVGEADSGNMSVGAWSRSVSITDLTPGLTYNITIVTLSDNLPSPAVAIMVYTLETSEGVRFSLNGITYQNNSLVTLENIGEWDDALLCVTDQPVCCRRPYGPFLGNWFFPNGTRLFYFYPNYTSDTQWDFFRSRGQMIVHMHRRRGGVNGIYRCEIPDAMNVTQTIYIGVYSASTAAGSPTNLNAAQVNLTSFRVSWTPPATVTGYQVYWSGGGGYDSGNMSARAEDRAVTITDCIPDLTYNITIVALSDHLPSAVVGAVMVTLACPQVMYSEYLASAVVGTFISTTLLYTIILLVSICVLIYWNKRHRTTTDTQVTQLDGAIVMKECHAYGEITRTGTDHVYATPHAVN